jgi:hypothetical protein
MEQCTAGGSLQAQQQTHLARLHGQAVLEHLLAMQALSLAHLVLSIPTMCTAGLKVLFLLPTPLSLGAGRSHGATGSSDLLSARATMQYIT